MNEIKFRLLDEQKKIVGYEKWYIGEFNMEIKKDYYVAKPQWLYSPDNKYWNPEYINHRYKNQFTGLHDHKENEIYEGDILVFKMIKHLPKYKEVFYINGLYYAGSDNLYVSLDNRNILAGNIYENPHLLEEPK
jgi:hypothetical protein